MLRLIMIEYLHYIIAILFLIVLSILDIKTFDLKEGYIPAFLTTGFLIIIFVTGNQNTIYSGILAGLLSIFFIEMEVFHGVPDIKIFIASAMTLPTMFNVIYFSVIMLFIGILYKSLILWRVTKGKNIEIPFIPTILISYLGILGVILL
jgi:hypothetical protein